MLSFRYLCSVMTLRLSLVKERPARAGKKTWHQGRKDATAVAVRKKNRVRVMLA